MYWHVNHLIWCMKTVRFVVTDQVTCSSQTLRASPNVNKQLAIASYLHTEPVTVIVIFSHKVWLWPLLILIKILSLDIQSEQLKVRGKTTRLHTIVA